MVWHAGTAPRGNPGGGVSGSVLGMLGLFDLVVFDGGLVVGGVFTHAGGVAAPGVARWDGPGWTPLVGGVPIDAVTALGVHDGQLYAGAAVFDGGAPVPTLVRWTGTGWETIAEEGVDDFVFVLASYGGDLYAGGGFTEVDEVAAQNIAKWNDSQGWAAVHGGTAGQVWGMEVFDDGDGDALFVGGEFEYAGTVEAHGVARLDAQGWSALGPGLDHSANAFAVLEEDGASALYVGGSFMHLQTGEPMRRVARWDGEAWEAVGVGLDDRVNALAVLGDGPGATLFAGGRFTELWGGEPAEHVAIWACAGVPTGPGPAPEPVGPCTDHTDCSGDYVCVEGACGCDGTDKDCGSGACVPAGGCCGDGDCGGDHVCGGGVCGCDVELQDCGGGACAECCDDGHCPGDEVCDEGSCACPGAMIACGSGICAECCGDGDCPGSEVCDSGSCVAGDPCDTAWESGVGDPGLEGGDVKAMIIWDGGGGAPALYAGGEFTGSGGNPASGIAQWNGTDWHTLGAGVTFASTPGHVHALAAHDDGSGEKLYVGGSFTQAGNVQAWNIARWTGATWESVGTGLDGDVYVFAELGGDLYAGGSFSVASQSANVARWDGSSWEPVGGGISGTVRALTVHDGTLYAGGVFSNPDEGILRLDGSTWASVAGGVIGAVESMAVHGPGAGDLYVGGQFEVAVSGGSTDNVARWDGVAWSEVGGGIDGPVHALAVLPIGQTEVLFAGGAFQNAGGQAASRLAQWDGSAWAVVCGGPNGPVFALAPYAGPQGSAMYLGGSFTHVNPPALSSAGVWPEGDAPGLDTLPPGTCTHDADCPSAQACEAGTCEDPPDPDPGSPPPPIPPDQEPDEERRRRGPRLWQVDFTFTFNYQTDEIADVEIDGTLTGSWGLVRLLEPSAFFGSWTHPIRFAEDGSEPLARLETATTTCTWDSGSCEITQMDSQLSIAYRGPLPAQLFRFFYDSADDRYLIVMSMTNAGGVFGPQATVRREPSDSEHPDYPHRDYQLDWGFKSGLTSSVPLHDHSLPCIQTGEGANEVMEVIASIPAASIHDVAPHDIPVPVNAARVLCDGQTDPDVTTSLTGMMHFRPIYIDRPEDVDGGNNRMQESQFVFDANSPGKRQLEYEAHVPQDPVVQAFLEENLRWRTPEIGDVCPPDPGMQTQSDLFWDGDDWYVAASHASYPHGIPFGQGRELSVEYISLPSCNEAFGPNELELDVFDMEFGTRAVDPDDPEDGYYSIDEVTYEVFFSKYATNHPGDHAALTGPDVASAPNWFYYWNDVVGHPDALFNSLPPTIQGRTPAMRLWTTYTGRIGVFWLGQEASEVYTHPITLEMDPAHCGTGIDCFANVILHERVHVSQILEYNPYILQEPTQDTSNSSMFWSFTIPETNPFWNHTHPFTGEDLDQNRNDVPDAHQHNAYGQQAVEAVAIEAMTIPDDEYAHLDWGAPGKNHRTEAYDD
jgi:trimeric autotransporter adhesin